MKKKILSLFLAFTLLLSVCALLPVSAETTADTTVVAKVNGNDVTLGALKTDWATYQAATIDMVENIQIVVSSWTSLATFSGTLNGNGASISGLNAPLFASVAGATINNLTVSGAITQDNNTAEVKVGLLAQTATGAVTLNKVTVTGSITITTTSTTYYKVNVGGMFGTAVILNLVECVSDCDIIQNTTTKMKDMYGGGIAGYITGKLTATKCVNLGDFSFKQEQTTLVGGFVGNMSNPTSQAEMTNFNNCSNFGNITLTTGSVGAKAGGFIGTSPNETTNELTNCYNEGTMTAGHVAGGMIGDARGICKFTSCVNQGNITSQNQYAGGIVGQFYEAKVGTFVRSCVNLGEISAANNAAGGIVSILAYGLTLGEDAFDGNVNKGNVSGKYASGMIAQINNGATHYFTNCLSTGTVTGTAGVGGVTAYISQSNVKLVISNFHYTADINAISVAKDGTSSYSLDGGASYTTIGVSSTTVDQTTVASLKAATYKANDGLTAALHTTAPKAQKSVVNGSTYDVRILFGIDGLNYNNTGFQIMRVEDGSYCTNMITKETTAVYTSVNSYNETDGTVETYTAQGKFGTDYIAAIAINGVPAGKTVSFIVRPFVTEQDGTVVYGNAYVFTYTVA